MSVPTQRRSIPIRGPFSWERAVDGLAGFLPLARQSGAKDVLRFAFRLDATFDAVAVALRPAGDHLDAVIAGTAEADSAAAQAARILSLDHAAPNYPDVAARDPAVGRLMDAL